MIAKAIERNVRKEKIARALDINVRSLSRKVQLLDGICGEAVGLLKDKMCPMAVFDVLRKMNPLRQIEAAELLINANNFSLEGATIHGFRSSFRDWAGNVSSFPREVVETPLAHIIGDKAEQAYRCSDALEKRRRLMDAWCAYCEPKTSVNVVPMRKQKSL